MDNIIETEKLIKQDNKNVMFDTIHPNDHGYGVLAQEIYMRLAFNKDLKERIDLITGSNMDLKQWT